jgi:CIC family chloride channel protein
VGTAWERVVSWVNGLELDENTILLAFALVIGVMGGLGVLGFYWLIDLAYAALSEWPSTVLPREGLLFYRPIFTAAGIAMAWGIAERLRRHSEGPTVPAVQVAVARRNGDVPAGPALGITAASAVTLGSGGSAGSEGPVAVLGAAVGSWLGRIFRFDPSRVKVLVAAGAAAGISAAFNAPLTGAFFALEEILGSLAVGAFPPVVVSSVVAAMVSRAAFGDHPALAVPEQYGYHLGWEVFTTYPLLGVVAGLTAVLYIRAYFGVPALAARLRIPRPAQPWIAGVLVGILVWLSGGALVGHGHLAVRVELFGRLAWTTLALLALGKILATAITLGMGGSGGVFTPSLYIGAVAGGAYGVLLSRLLPDVGLRPEGYALVGMGVVVAVATSAPITAILIVFEMTNDYAIMLPLMLATVIGVLVARRFEKDDLYSGWLRRRGENSSTARTRTSSPGCASPRRTTPTRRSSARPRRWTSCWSTSAAASRRSSRWWTPASCSSASSPSPTSPGSPRTRATWHPSSSPPTWRSPPRPSSWTTRCSPRSGRWASAAPAPSPSSTAPPADSRGCSPEGTSSCCTSGRWRGSRSSVIGHRSRVATARANAPDRRLMTDDR